MLKLCRDFLRVFHFWTKRPYCWPHIAKKFIKNSILEMLGNLRSQVQKSFKRRKFGHFQVLPMAKIVATTKDQRFALHQRKIPDLAIEKSILRTDSDSKRTKSIKFMDISDKKKCNMALYHLKRHLNVSDWFKLRKRGCIWESYLLSQRIPLFRNKIKFSTVDVLQAKFYSTDKYF